MKPVVFSSSLAFSLLSVWGLPDCAAQAHTETLNLPHLVVVANKTPRPIQDVVGSVVSFSAEDIARTQAENMDDLLRYQPNITMESAGNRFQSTSINIRGIGGDRVAIRVDGVPVADQFDVGHFGNSGKALPELDIVRQVEILKGPASTMYGSDAIGGVVTFDTWDPVDLVHRTAGPTYYKVRAGYEGKNHGRVMTGTAAAQGEKTGLLTSITFREGKALNNDKFTRTVQDKLAWTSSSLFAKVTWDLGDTDRLTFSVNHHHTDSDSNNYSLLGQGRTFGTTTQLSGQDKSDNDRFSLQYEFDTDLTMFEENMLRLYYREHHTEQDTSQWLRSHGSPVRRDRRFDYKQSLWGLEWNAVSQIGRHSVVTGMEWMVSRSKELRDGLQTNLSTGTTTHTVLGEALPVRDFPKSTTIKLGVFAQDEIKLAPSWTVVPALRFDYYHLIPKADRIFTEDNPNITVTAITERSLSPKLGIVKQFSHGASAYLHYARGYRAAPFEDANIGLDIIAGPTHIRAIPNPGLKSETSNGFELGIRQGQPDRHLNLSVFYTRYHNFIETKAPLGPDPADPTVLLFQSRNVNNAEIYGVEFSYKQQLSAVAKTLTGWSITTRLAASRGEDRDTSQPINTIAPAQAVIDLAWQSQDGRWQWDIIDTLTHAKKRVDDSKVKGSSGFIRPAGSSVFDVLARYQLTPHSQLRFAVFNVTNKQYWRWQDVMGLTHDQYDSVYQSLVRPERHVSVSFTTEW